MELSLQQQFELIKLKATLEQASREQLIELTLDAFKQVMQQRNATAELVGKAWGITE